MYLGFSARISRSFGWIAVMALLLVSTSSYATHLAGGELTYQWVSGTTYIFTATFYRDCAGINAPTTLPLSYISNTCGITGSATLNLVAGTGNEITFPCQSAKTTCSGGTNPGFQEWQYTATVNLGKKCTDWVFSWVSNARNNAITTIQNPGSDNMYIEATLNNVIDSTASSPTFSNFPVAILCIGQPFNYNQGSLAPNGDSLAYSFICPRVLASTCVTFINPYSATNPIASTPPAAIDPVTGNITMTPTTVQVGVTTVLVKKYHNGVFVGSVIRDMEFITQNCGTNNLPTASGVNGTNVYSDTICAGVGAPVCFSILSNDVDAGQIVTMTWNSGIAGATFTVAGSPHPTGTFCWQPTYADASANPHTFTVTVRDNNCPTNGVQVFSYAILVPPIIVTPNTTNILCNGGTGSATAVGSGGISPYTYSWSPTSQTTATATGLSAGTTYTVTATDNHGCTNTNTITLTQPSAISASITSQTNVSCTGGTNGSATVTASGGTGALTHHWSNGQTTNPITNLITGTYTDTVKDANGCIKLVSITITQPAASLLASITSQQNASCKGNANGKITVTVTGGTLPYLYSWSPAVGTDSTVTGLVAGTYTVTVTDAHGCTTSKTATITEPGTLVPLITDLTVTGGIISCFGATNGSLSVSVTGGTPAYHYLWSPGGATTDTITGLGAGTYSVTVTDANLCTADTSIVLKQPDSLIVTIPTFSTFFGGVNISCNGASDGFVNLSVTGGTPGFHYLWSPGGQTADSLAGIPAGTYSVTVTDTNGCSSGQSITLIQPGPLVGSEFSHSNVGCNGEATGGIVLTVSGGTGPFTYTWSPNVATDSVATGLAAGTYTISISDMNGCATTFIDTISQPATIFPLITAATVTGGLNIACSGDSTGTAWATVTGGTPPFKYLWSPGGATTDTVTGLSAGPISVHIIDINGCSKTAFDTITQPEPLSAFYTDSIFAGGANVSCNANSDGSIIQQLIGGGTPGYTYSWSNGETTANDTGLSATTTGTTYTVLITDTNGCKLSLPFTLFAPQPLTDSLVAATTNGGWNISCNGASDGSITAFVNGGTSPYFYTWSPNVSTTSTASNLGAGTYIITVSDTNNCSSTDSITLTQPPVLFDTLSAKVYVGGKNISCFGYSDGSITDSVSGGTAPYTFQWNTGDTTQSIGLIPAGTYVVNITDANGCTRTDSITLTQPDSINTIGILSSFNGFTIACHGGTGCVDLVISGGTPGYHPFWTPTEDSTFHFCDTAGTYNVVVTDTNGCFSIRNFTFTQPDSLISASATSNYGGSNVSCSNSLDGTITVTVTGGVRPFFYSWSPPEGTDSTATGLGAGTYVITVTDSNGCSTVVSTTLIAPPPFTDSVVTSVYAGGYSVSCAGNDGFINIIPTGGTRPYHYVWAPPVSTDSTASGLMAGLYIITVTDSNGCSVIDSVTLTQANPFNVTDSLSNYNGQNISCVGSTNGCIYVTVTGGVPAYTFLWNTGDTTQNLCNLGAGTYTDTITDAQGCRTFITATITAPPPLSLSATDSSYNGSGIKCAADSNGYIHVIVTGGTVPMTYLWSPNVSTDSIASGLGAGTYSYTVTDANGCSATGSQTITAPQPLSLSAIDSSYNGSGIKCAADSNGYIHVIVTGGTVPITYLWSPNVSTDSIASGLAAGIYSYTVTDANGCSATGSQTITAPQPLSISAIDSSYNGSGIKCATDSNGYIHVIVTGGTGQIIYVWSPNVSMDSIASGLAAGIYSYTVTDANGCSATGSQTITAPQPLSLSAIDSSYNGSGVKCATDSNGYIHVIVMGGTVPVTYVWSPNVSTDSIASGLAAGIYSYTVTDANGCSATGSQTITSPQPLSLSAIDSSYNGVGIKCAADSNGYIHVIVTGGTGPMIYTWNPSTASTDSIAQNLGAGTYSYSVTDANGCSATGSQTLTGPQPISLSAIDSSYGGSGTKCNGDKTGYIHVIATGGTPAYTYTWNPSTASTDSIAQNLAAGPYSYTVTDANGCSATGSQMLTSNPVILVAAGKDAQVCGDSTQLSGSSPASGETGTWSVISGTGTFSNANDSNTVVTGLTRPGTNIFLWTVTNGFCSASDTVNIETFDVIASEAGADLSICPQDSATSMLNATPVKLGTAFWISLGKAGVDDSSKAATGVHNLVTGNNIFVWVVTNGACIEPDSVIVNLKDQDLCFDSLQMPNGFTPNGDGHNDDFDIHGIENYPNNTLTIFNRWGNEVYSADDYKNHTWVGQNKSGEPLPDGTYFAILIIKNSDIKLHGYVDLRRK